MNMEREQMITLVRSVQGGNKEASNQLFTEYYNDIYYFALKTVKDENLASDVTQDTFITVLNHIDGLKEPAAFPSWIRQIAYRQCLQYFKKKQDVLVSEDEDGNTIFDTLREEHAEFIPDEAVDNEEFRKTIWDMIETLSESQKSAIMLFYFDELSVKEIAKIQEVSEGTIKSRLNYGRKALETAVNDYEKKTGVKLHSFALAPFLFWLFGMDKAESGMPASVIKGAVDEIVSAGGTANVAGTTAGTAAEAATSAAKATGLGAKMLALPVAIKVASIAILAILVISVVTLLSKDENGKGKTAGGNEPGRVTDADEIIEEVYTETDIGATMFNPFDSPFIANLVSNQIEETSIRIEYELPEGIVYNSRSVPGQGTDVNAIDIESGGMCFVAEGDQEVVNGIGFNDIYSLRIEHADVYNEIIGMSDGVAKIDEFVTKSGATCSVYEMWAYRNGERVYISYEYFIEIEGTELYATFDIDSSDLERNKEFVSSFTFTKQ